MPLGNAPWNAPPPSRTPQIVPVPPTSVAPAPPQLVERQAGTEIWRHVTADATDTTAWSNGYVIDFGGFITDLTIYCAEPIYVSLDRGNVSPEIGGYDLINPGGGFLSTPIPPTKRIAITTGDGGAPSSHVEVWGMAGSFAIRR